MCLLAFARHVQTASTVCVVSCFSAYQSTVHRYVTCYYVYFYFHFFYYYYYCLYYYCYYYY